MKLRKLYPTHEFVGCTDCAAGERQSYESFELCAMTVCSFGIGLFPNDRGTIRQTFGLVARGRTSEIREYRGCGN
jgi:hypothetical protein